MKFGESGSAGSFSGNLAKFRSEASQSVSRSKPVLSMALGVESLETSRLPPIKATSPKWHKSKKPSGRPVTTEGCLREVG